MQLIAIFSAELLKEISMPIFKTGWPDGDLVAELYKVDEDDQPVGEAIYTKHIQQEALCWSLNVFSFSRMLQLKRKGKSALVLRSGISDAGCYGPFTTPGQRISQDAASLRMRPCRKVRRVMKFQYRCKILFTASVICYRILLVLGYFLHIGYFSVRYIEDRGK